MVHALLLVDFHTLFIRKENTKLFQLAEFTVKQPKKKQHKSI